MSPAEQAAMERVTDEWDKNKSPSRIVCAANRCRKTGLVIPGPPRHFDPVMHSIMLALDAKGGDWRRSEEGFITQHGEFLTREQAWVVAERAGQIFRRFPCPEGVLYSEHLY